MSCCFNRCRKKRVKRGPTTDHQRPSTTKVKLNPSQSEVVSQVNEAKESPDPESRGQTEQQVARENLIQDDQVIPE